MNAPVEIEYVEVPGATLWTARQGSGPPVILLHGGPGLWDYLGPVAEMIDYLATVYRYDQRACGRSSGGPPYTMSGAIADLEALREHWGHERWVLLGHSWGAMLGLAYALAHPEHTRALVYMSGTGIYADWREAFQANVQARTSPELEFPYPTPAPEGRGMPKGDAGEAWRSARRIACLSYRRQEESFQNSLPFRRRSSRFLDESAGACRG